MTIGIHAFPGDGRRQISQLPTKSCNEEDGQATCNRARFRRASWRSSDIEAIFTLQGVMDCPLHGGGHLKPRGALAPPPPQLTPGPVGGRRPRRDSVSVSHERHRPCRECESKTYYPATDAPTNSSYCLMDKRPLSPGNSWAEPGKGWTRYSSRTRSNRSPSADPGVCRKRCHTRRAFRDVAPAIDAPVLDGRGWHDPSDELQSVRKSAERLDGSCGLDTAWAMSYLSRRSDVSREGTGLRKTQRKRAGRHTRQPTTNATRPEKSCTGSRRQNVAHVAETHALKHKQDNARMYNKGLLDSNSELARQQVVALRRKVESIAPPANIHPAGQSTYARTMDIHAQGGESDAYRASVNTFTETDAAFHPPHFPRSSSTQGSGRRGGRERGARYAEHEFSRREDHPASSIPKACPSTVDYLPAAVKGSRAIAQARQTKPHRYAVTQTEARDSVRPGAYAQTQTEAGCLIGEACAGLASALAPSDAPRTENASVFRDGEALEMFNLTGPRRAVGFGGSGPGADARWVPAGYARFTSLREEPKSRRCTISEDSPRCGAQCGEEVYSCEGSELDGRSHASVAGGSVEAEQAWGRRFQSSVGASQPQEDGVSSAAGACVGVHENPGLAESAGRAEGMLSGSERQAVSGSSRCTSENLDNVGNVETYLEDGVALPAQAIRSTVPDGPPVEYGHKVNGYPATSEWITDSVVVRRSSSWPSLGQGGGSVLLPSALTRAPKPNLVLDHTIEAQQMSNTAPGKTAVDVSKREGAGQAESPARVEVADDSKREGVGQADTATLVKEVNHAAQTEAQGGESDAYRASVNTFTETDAAFHPPDFPRSSSTQGSGRRGGRERRASCVDEIPSTREDHPASSIPKACPSTVDCLLGLVEGDRVLAQAPQTPQTKSHPYGGTGTEARDSERTETHAQTQTEAGCLIGEACVDIASAPVPRAVSVPESTHVVRDGEALERVNLTRPGIHGLVAFGGSGPSADVGFLPVGHPGLTSLREESKSSRCAISEDSPRREGHCGEEVYSCEGSESDGTSHASVSGVDVEEKQAPGRWRRSSVGASQPQEDGVSSAAGACVGVHENPGLAESAGRAEGMLSGSEQQGLRGSSRCTSENLDNVGNVETYLEGGIALPAQAIRSTVPDGPPVGHGHKVNGYPAAFERITDSAVARRSSSWPSLGQGGSVLLPSALTRASKPNPVLDHTIEAQQMSPSTIPGEAAVDVSKREGVGQADTATLVKEVNHTAQTEHLERKLYSAKCTVAAFKIAFLLARSKPFDLRNDTGGGLCRIAALSESTPQVALAFSRWSTRGCTGESRGREVTKTSDCAAQTAPEEARASSHDSIDMQRGASSQSSKEFPQSAAAALTSSPRHGAESPGKENGLVEQALAKRTIERGTGDEDTEQARFHDMPPLPRESRHPLYPPMPPMPLAPAPLLSGVRPKESKTSLDGRTAPQAFPDAAPEPLLVYTATRDPPSLLPIHEDSNDNGEREQAGGSFSRGTTGEVQDRDHGPAANQPGGDRAPTTPSSLSSEGRENTVSPPCKEKARDQTTSPWRETTSACIAVAATVLTAEGGEWQQLPSPKSAFHKSAFHNDHVEGSPAQTSTQAPESKEKRETTFTTPDKEEPDTACSLTMVNATEKKLVEEEHHEDGETAPGAGRKGNERYGRQRHTLYIATETKHAEAMGQASLYERRDARRKGKGSTKDTKLGRKEEQYHHESRAVVENGKEEDTGSSYRRDCAVLAGTAKIVFALMAVEHRRVSCRFYRWKRTRSPSYRQRRKYRSSGNSPNE
ncbi:unnamed protein product [Ectocarpus sp. 4 AP-2014]